MTRTYAAKRLLEHGPLTTRQFAEITGWGKEASQSVMYQLSRTGVVIGKHVKGTRQIVYFLSPMLIIKQGLIWK